MDAKDLTPLKVIPVRFNEPRFIIPLCAFFLHLDACLTLFGNSSLNSLQIPWTEALSPGKIFFIVTSFGLLSIVVGPLSRYLVLLALWIPNILILLLPRIGFSILVSTKDEDRLHRQIAEGKVIRLSQLRQYSLETDNSVGSKLVKDIEAERIQAYSNKNLLSVIGLLLLYHVYFLENSALIEVFKIMAFGTYTPEILLSLAIVLLFFAARPEPERSSYLFVPEGNQRLLQDYNEKRPNPKPRN